MALLSFSLIGPTIVVDRSGDLPECCRKAGKHHCAMMATGDADEDPAPGAAFKSIPEKCPFYRNTGPVPSPVKTIVVRASQQLVAVVISYPTLIAQAESRYRVSFNRSRQKRGPPSVRS